VSRVGPRSGGRHDDRERIGTEGIMAGFPRHWDFDEVYDSFDRGCGDFIMDLRQVMADLPAGTTLMIASRDAGAPVEIPAWCRLTGHALVDAEPPFYLVRKKTT
jgi:tRNA 2-thiouridine synthesizing protein A